MFCAQILANQPINSNSNFDLNKDFEHEISNHNKSFATSGWNEMKNIHETGKSNEDVLCIRLYLCIMSVCIVPKYICIHVW